MKRLTLVLSFILSSFLAPAQTQSPNLLWSNFYGGSSHESASSIKSTKDGGSIVTGYTYSNDGDVSYKHSWGGTDIWVVKLNRLGEIEWEKTYGGTYHDHSTSILETEDGGYILTGYTTSSDGDVVGKRSDWSDDGWVVKLSSNGLIEWQRILGTRNTDKLESVTLVKGGGYVVAGYSFNSDGIRDADGWIVKLDSIGQIVWEKRYGGSQNDRIMCVQQTFDNGFILTGYTNSNDGNISQNKGDSDLWVLKLNESGDLEWIKTYGGTREEIGYSIKQTLDSNYIVAGVSLSSNGDLTKNNQNSYDVWVVKLNFNGDIQWQKNYGGSGWDSAKEVLVMQDGSFVVGGYTDSNDLDVTDFHGGRGDFWVLKISNEGNLIWQKTLGSIDSEDAFSLDQSNDGGIIVAGHSYSMSVYGKTSHGGQDFWIAKLQAENCTIFHNTIIPVTYKQLGRIDFSTTLANNSYNLSFVKNGLNLNRQIDVFNSTFSLDSLTEGVYSNFSVSTSNCISSKDIRVANVLSICDKNILLTSPDFDFVNQTKIIKASQLEGRIKASNSIKNNSNILYNSAVIELLPGFSVNPGSVFSALPIGGCE